MSKHTTLNFELFESLNKALPRYTSYPTAPTWETIPINVYEETLRNLPSPLSLYFHLPFCETMCLFCACSVVLNRDQDKEKAYVNSLLNEIDLITSIMGEKRKVTQLHFGGGTPTKISIDLLDLLFQKITSRFEIDFSKEVAIEIDPRTVTKDKGEKLRFLRHLGFNRVSFGVQDTNQDVQEAIRRRQSLEVTQETFFLAKECGFHEINIDLIYGLPLQTFDTFQKTIEDILKLRPDRIALFSYAKVPWLKPHQKAIRDDDLPPPFEKFRIYVSAREAFLKAGYEAIGMDHFALKGNELSKSYQEKTLHRNFQGYTVKRSDHLLGFGTTAISDFDSLYTQNQKELSSYSECLKNRKAPLLRGKILTLEDQMRKWVIQSLMCRFELEKKEWQKRFALDFDTHFESVEPHLQEMEIQGLLQNTQDKIVVKPFGELFIRNIAALFDAYLQKESKIQFSQSV